ncbi:MAG: rhomboid family intramembrane serine protease [Acidobacteria bacterium]|nr:rhomboid family intramembrane serine protease [Acidobacteriota bacterium]
MPLSPRIKWKITRFGKKADEQLNQARNLMRSVWGQQRMCPACRALVGRKEKICPFCQERMTGGHGGALDRLLSSFIPDQMRYTVFFLTVNVLLYLLTLAASMKRLGGEMDARFLFGSIDGYTLVRFGAKYGMLIVDGEWWRFLTPIFLHGSLLHLGMNCWVLYDLGPTVESLYGRQRYLVLYVLTGIAGNVLSYWWYPNTLSIGASGAILGLVGAMITYGYRNRSRLGDSVRNMFVRWAIYVLIFGFLVPFVDNGAHIGGLLAGMAFGYFVSDMPAVTSGRIYFWKALQVVVTLLVLGSFLMVGLRPSV